MGLTKQPAHRKQPAEASERPARGVSTGASLPLPSASHGGEDELFRDPFADFLPSTR